MLQYTNGKQKKIKNEKWNKNFGSSLTKKKKTCESPQYDAMLISHVGLQSSKITAN